MSDYASLHDFIDRHKRVFDPHRRRLQHAVGHSRLSRRGWQWKALQPVTYQAFMGEEKTRRRYWARSLIGWRLIRHAHPMTRIALWPGSRRGQGAVASDSERRPAASGGRQREVIDLHGRIDLVRCMDCEGATPREALQEELSRLNGIGSISTRRMRRTATPTSRARIFRPSHVLLPALWRMFKPDVVFFGENVPRDRVNAAARHLDRADAVLIIGSSLMVYSGFRFVQCGREPANRWPQSILAAPAPTGFRAEGGAAVRIRLRSCCDR